MAEEKMNRYALYGHKVRCIDDSYLSEEQNIIELGEIYEIESTTISAKYGIKIYLTINPLIHYQIWRFEDVTIQPKELDKKHLNYHDYKTLTRWY